MGGAGTINLFETSIYAGNVVLAIITLTMQGDNWVSSVHRILAVLIGCLCTVLVNASLDKPSVKFAAWLRQKRAQW